MSMHSTVWQEAATCAPVRRSARETSHIFHDRDFIPVRHSLYYIKFILPWERNNDGIFHIDLRVLKIHFRDDRIKSRTGKKKEKYIKLASDDQSFYCPIHWHYITHFSATKREIDRIQAQD